MFGHRTGPNRLISFRSLGIALVKGGTQGRSDSQHAIAESNSFQNSGEPNIDV